MGDLDDASDDKYAYQESLFRFLNTIQPSVYPASIITNPTENFPENITDSDRFRIFSRNVFWHKALDGDDQLRQRVTYALSQLLVTSKDSPAGKYVEL